MAIEVVGIDKHPSEVLPYSFDFSRWSSLIDQSALASATVTADVAGLTIGSPSVSGYRATSVISGGTDGTVYTLTALATTVDGYVIAAVAEVNVYIP